MKPSRTAWTPRSTLAICAGLFLACSSPVSHDRADGSTDHGDSSVPDDAAPLPPDARGICDGTEDLRFAAYLISTALLDPSLKSLQTVGWSYLYVDGRCHYWTVDALPFRETHEGELTEEQAQALAKDFHYGSWSEIQGAWGSDGIHGPWIIVHDSRTGVACYFGCAGAPASVRAVTDRTVLDGWIGQLYDAGRPLSGPIRLAFEAWGWEGTGYGDDFSIRPSPWPLRQQPSEIAPWIHNGTRTYAGPAENPPGGHLIAELDATSALRAARADKATYSYPPWLALGPAEGGYASIQLRDVLPFEDAEGHIPEPPLVPRD